MEKESTEIYCGNGVGKTTLALGQSMKASVQGKSVIMIQFLKGKEKRELDFLEELDNLDIKIFRFERFYGKVVLMKISLKKSVSMTEPSLIQTVEFLG